MLKYCEKCVMDGTADITLENGVCNYCRIAQKELALLDKHKLPNIIERIKKDGKAYDCLIGLSGGVDSSTALHHLVELGLRPLCFSVDNGWQDPKADENIMRLVEGLQVPFYRYTIDLDRFKELQSAFLKAGLINAEIPTDHILMATTYEMAAKYGIKWVISGGNVATESIMPPEWSYTARDLVHIKDIYKKMTGKDLKGLPVCSLAKFNYYKWIKRIKTFYLLDFIGYNRQESIKLLEEKYGYKNYGDKHEESIFTNWFQNFYLYEKFGIDKRKAHYSSLINAGQMTRAEARELLKKVPVYPKLGLEGKVMQYPKRSHDEFKKDEKLWRFITTFIRVLRKPYRKLSRSGVSFQVL